MAVTGWLRDAGASFDNKRDFANLRSLSSEHLDESRVAYFESYLDEYFSGEFRTGQGTEHILGFLAKYGAGGRWLDIGAGTTTLFWALPLDRVETIVAADIVPEALVVLREFCKRKDPPACYRQVMNIFNKDHEHFSRMCESLTDYYAFDIFQDWPADVAKAGPFDMVTAFGVLGLGGSPETYKRCVENLSSRLARDGVFIGANWVRSRELNDRDPVETAYIDQGFIELVLDENGLELLELKEEKITGDPLYQSVLLWASRVSSGKRPQFRADRPDG